MNKVLLVVLTGLSVLFVSGCAVTTLPNGDVIFRPAILPVAVQTGQQEVEPVTVEEQFDYVGDTTPVAVVGYDVPFYPRYIVGCDCIVPIAFVGGVWINGSGVRVMHDGHWRAPPQHIISAHREMLRRNPQMMRQWQPRNGPAGQTRHVAPSPAIHSQQGRPQQQARPPQQVRPQQQVRPPQQVRPQQQARPPQQVQRAPAARAPAKNCPQGQKC